MVDPNVVSNTGLLLGSWRCHTTTTHPLQPLGEKNELIQAFIQAELHHVDINC